MKMNIDWATALATFLGGCATALLVGAFAAWIFAGTKVLASERAAERVWAFIFATTAAWLAYFALRAGGVL